MKKSVILFLLLMPSLLYGQNRPDIPKMKFYGERNKINKYVEFPDLSDKNAIIITTEIYPYKSKIKSFLVLCSNGKMYKYASLNYDLHENNIKSEIRSKEVIGDEKLHFLDLIKKINSLRIFKANDLEAYNYWQELNKGYKNTYIVLDGRTYSLEVFQKRDPAIYSTSFPESYIANQQPSYELVKTYLSIFKEFDFQELFEND